MSFTKEVESLAEEIVSFSRSRHTVGRTFDDLLTYALHRFSLNAEPLGRDQWPYGEQENRWFTQILSRISELTVTQEDSDNFVDVLGELYMAFVAGRYDRQAFGQYFTPVSIATLMASVLYPKDAESICDPCCGSGRLLLAGAKGNADIVCFGNDLDSICTKMCACNLLLHGRRGVVTRGNTLSCDYFGGYAVNTPTGNSALDSLPHILVLSAQEAAAVWMTRSPS